MKIHLGLAIILASGLIMTATAANDVDVSALPYDKAAEFTLEGAALSQGRSLEMCRNGVFFKVKDFEIYVGPTEFVKSLGFTLDVGTAVTVIGTPTVFQEKKVLLARSLTVGKKIFVIRDRNGVPKWLDLPVEMDPECSAQPRNQAQLK